MEVHTEGLSTKKGGARVKGKWSAAKHGKGGVDCNHADWKQEYVLPCIQIGRTWRTLGHSDQSDGAKLNECRVRNFTRELAKRQVSIETNRA